LPECGFDSDSNAVTVYTSTGESKAIEKMDKEHLAEKIFKIILEYMEKLS
jgi:phosphopantothenoylcysteine synthetase/decarboxylase